jgi:hypothetical protein
MTRDTQFKIGDKVRVVATGNEGVVIDVARATRDRRSPLIPYIEYTRLLYNPVMISYDVSDPSEATRMEHRPWDIDGKTGCQWDWFLDDSELELLP